MTISRFAAELVEVLSREALPADLDNEQDFERRFIIPLASRVGARHRDISVLSHPFHNKRRCTPDCEAARDGESRVVGCPRCWAKSKRWASVAAFGTHHNFDVVAKDSLQTLVVEIKLVTARGGRMPNGELQRFLGQCSLAATKHAVVVGVCGCRGRFNAKWHKDCEGVKQWFAQRGIHLVFRTIGGPSLCAHAGDPGARANQPMHLPAGAPGGAGLDRRVPSARRGGSAGR